MFILIMLSLFAAPDRPDVEAFVIGPDKILVSSRFQIKRIDCDALHDIFCDERSDFREVIVTVRTYAKEFSIRVHIRRFFLSTCVFTVKQRHGTLLNVVKARAP